MSRVLEGKVALVSGARTGLGAATAVALAGQGATVLASGRRAGDCGPIVERIEQRGGRATDFALDVSDLSAMPARAAEVLARHGRLDIIVNNAATIAPHALFGGLDGEDFHDALRINVSGPAALVSAVWPRLVEQGGARVINVVSGASNRAIRGWAAYCASKAALLMLTQAIELEGRPHNIRAFALAPGLVDTDMQATIRAARVNEIAEVPRANLLPADEPARVLAWLATGDADDLAGKYLDVRQDDVRARALGAG
jgi:NAD(P)-dependent dehydrogenase (short-subunit alcohol dehydrogenase family)